VAAGSAGAVVPLNPLSSNSKGLASPNPGIAISPTRREIAGIDLLRKLETFEIGGDVAASAISPLVGEIAIPLCRYRDGSSR